MSSALTDPHLGKTLDGRYRLDHLLALGGMSRIYRSMDKRLHRAVVVKILNDNFASEPTVRERFESEAVIAANITHPNVVSIRDHNVSDNLVYLVMEYVRGRNLDQVIAERGKFTPRQMLSVLEQICRGLSAAHSEGIIHRDMKPANVLVADSGEIKLTDFGLARAASAHTQSATLLATLSHVSPELVSGAAADSRSDIYALGIMIYQMLTGALPYAETNPAAMMKHHLDSPMPLPSQAVAGLAEDLDELVRWCTEKDPEKRPQDASLLLAEVRQIHSTLTEEQLDLGIETLGTVADLIPKTFTHMPTTLQQRLDAMQRDRELEREQQWLALNSTSGEGDYEVDQADVSESPTTVIAADDATEVLNLRDAQATMALPRDTNASGPAILHATTAYSRDDLAPHEPEANDNELSARDSKRAQKQASKRWRKEAQIPTHRLRKPRTGTQKLVITLMWVLIVALVASAGWFFGRGPGTIVRIPSLNGMLQERAISQMDSQGVPVRISSVYDDEVAVGRVVDSRPSSGANIMKFQGVELTVSQGPELFDVPQTAGMKVESAKKSLAKAGFENVSTTEEYSSSVDSGSVIGTSPEAGKQIPKKNTIKLTVSKGHAPVQVPSVIGLSQEEADAKLREAGLSLKLGTEIHSSQIEQGLVAAQDPADGTAEFGSAVEVSLSSGPEYVQIPSVVGLSVQDATEQLEAAGFQVKLHSVFGGANESVRMQTPLSQQAIYGSEISIYAF
ncbi:Stk1 family PASTA domain-containing Ser/Thr kinase [Glutamicibacter sp.]|uniref:Stk1 family PASTA domain-containing Ser/Thr kinase n=1 Tax=Glutamicibacter sp. TaxID=1931995 RepID=UPI002FE3868E